MAPKDSSVFLSKAVSMLVQLLIGYANIDAYTQEFPCVTAENVEKAMQELEVSLILISTL